MSPIFSQSYPLDIDGNVKLLELSWNLLWRGFTVRLAGQIIGTVSGGLRDLKQGREFALSDGSVLRIQFARGLLALSRNDVPLPGSPVPPAPPRPSLDTSTPIRTVATLLLLIAALALLVAVLYGAIWATETSFFASWPLVIRCGLAFAIFVSFMAFSFFASLKTRPRTARDWLFALGSYIERLLEMAGKDPYRGL